MDTSGAGSAPSSAPAPASAPAAVSTIKTEEITYEANGTTMKGLLAYDASNDELRPGVLVVHEWWGHNAYARKRARQLAEMGYVALAVDMYGDGKTADHPGDAQKFATAVFSNLDDAQARFVAAKQALVDHPMTDSTRTAAIGYCFGGGIVLNMARRGVFIDAVASFHGSLDAPAPAQPGTVKARVLVLHGAADPFVSADAVEAFKKEMDAAKVDMEFVAYDGVKHSFTNPDADKFGTQFKLPLEYNEAADLDSWSRLEKFLATTFGDAE